MIVWDALLDVLRSALFALSHLYGGSFGGAIITLSVIVRLALLPMTMRAARRSPAMRRKMLALQPELARLQKKHASDPGQLRAATLALYAREGIRPLRDSGIGASLVQAPIGYAMFSVIRQGFGAGSKFLWVGNLARPDFALSLLTAILTAAMMLSAPGPDGAEPNRALAIAFAVITFFMVWQIASGVTLYWASSTAMSCLQNVVHRRAKA